MKVIPETFAHCSSAALATLCSAAVNGWSVSKALDNRAP